MSPDPHKAGIGSADSATPQSWNRYAYTRNDPVTRIDPKGLDDCNPDDPSCNSSCGLGLLAGPGGACERDPDPEPETPAPVIVATDCTITLEYRPIRSTGFLSRLNHAYIFVTRTDTYSDGTVETLADLIEGLPEREQVNNWGALQAKVFYNFNVSGDARDPVDHPWDPRHPASGDGHLRTLIGHMTTSLDPVCKKGADLENEAGLFRKDIPYDPSGNGTIYAGGRNSNWLAWRLLRDNGLDLGTPPSVPGWGFHREF